MLTVLIASGDNAQINSVSDTLRSHFPDSCLILKATQRRDLYDFLHSVRIHMLILDMNLSDINCQVLLQQFYDSNPGCTVLLLADLSSLDGIQGMDFPVMDYLVRPYSDRELILTLEEALYHCSRTKNTAPGAVSKLQIIREQIEAYIQSNYAQIISMQDVAQAMNYSDTHFCRLFKQCFNVNFSVYLNEFRVEQAKKLLADTNLTVKEVSIACGYRDTSYFIRVFKRFTGITPADYRLKFFSMIAKKSNKS